MGTLRLKTRVTLAVALALLFAVRAQAAEVVLVAHPGSSTPTLTKDDVQTIFTGRKTRWSTGATIVPVLLEDDQIHTSFLAVHVQKTPAQFDNFWKMRVFTGKGSPLRSFRTEREVVAFVAQTEGAIGYVSRGAVNDSVRAIEIK